MFISLQVLSASVANALEYHGDSDSTETAKFVCLFDRFFDCFNARSIDECIKKRKPDLGPYRDPSDSRRLTFIAIIAVAERQIGKIR